MVTVCLAVSPSCKKVLSELFTLGIDYVRISVVTMLLSTDAARVLPSGKT